MNTEALFLFLILLLGLVMCSFLGGNCGQEGFSGKLSGTFNVNKPKSDSGASTSSPTQYDNYNHFTGNSTALQSGSVYYGPQGTTATVVSNSDGTQTLQIILPGSSSPVSFTPQNNIESYVNISGQNGSITKYYGPNGGTATIVNTNNGQLAIKVETSSGTYYYNVTNGQTDTSTQYYGSTGTPIDPYYGPNAAAVTGPQGNTAYYAEGPNGNSVAGIDYNNYSSTLPQGIPRSQIPPGQEDLYILKSEIVPPVCPACPTAAACPRQEKCPPCPACARCPEPSFECKKVPNYNAINNDFLPSPILNDFSQFGM